MRDLQSIKEANSPKRDLLGYHAPRHKLYDALPMNRHRQIMAESIGPLDVRGDVTGDRIPTGRRLASECCEL